MTDLLRKEIVTPTRTYARRAVVLGLGCGLLGTSLVIAASRMIAPLDAQAPEIAVVMSAPVPVPVPLVMIVAADAPAPPPPSPALAFVFSAGTTSYMKLADLAKDDADAAAEARPRHAALRLVADATSTSAVGTVRDRDVPIAYRSWKGRRVRVDGGCEATVTGFAVVSRLTGDPGYAGHDGDAWTASSVMSSGATMLAARLDGCTGLYARDASLPPMIIPTVIDDPALAAAARAALIASEPSETTQREWDELGSNGTRWHEESTVLTQVLRHPRTGVTWVSVHGVTEFECGGGNANLWGLFRVERNGTLTAVELRDLGDLSTIEKLIDVDGDGTLEMVGRSVLGNDLVFTTPSGDELARLDLPFFGCAC